jgi:hypothetical protein
MMIQCSIVLYGEESLCATHPDLDAAGGHTQSPGEMLALRRGGISGLLERRVENGELHIVRYGPPLAIDAKVLWQARDNTDRDVR